MFSWFLSMLLDWSCCKWWWLEAFLFLFSRCWNCLVSWRSAICVAEGAVSLSSLLFTWTPSYSHPKCLLPVSAAPFSNPGLDNACQKPQHTVLPYRQVFLECALSSPVRFSALTVLPVFLQHIPMHPKRKGGLFLKANQRREDVSPPRRGAIGLLWALKQNIKRSALSTFSVPDHSWYPLLPGPQFDHFVMPMAARNSQGFAKINITWILSNSGVP